MKVALISLLFFFCWQIDFYKLYKSLQVCMFDEQIAEFAVVASLKSFNFIFDKKINKKN